jgi:methionyl-tRNA formyltransferase
VTKQEGELDWTATAAEVHNKVRGLQPWPLASTRLRGARYVLRRTAPLPETTTLPAGAVVRAERDAFVVACGNGTTLAILEIQPEGRRPMSAREFLAGHRPRAGDRLGT